MKFVRRALLTSLAFTVFAGMVQTTPAIAETARAAVLAEDPPPSSPARPMPPELYKEWNGQDGVAPFDSRLRTLVADIAKLDEDAEVRAAATAALAKGDREVREFLDTGVTAVRAQANARRAETDRQNRAAIEPLRGTGGQYLKSEVDRVLAGSPSDRANFLLYGKAIAEQRDAASVQDTQARAAQNRARVQMLVAAGGLEVKKAAQAALDAGDVAIAEFLNTGYLNAAKADADAREQFLKDQEARDKAAEELSDLAKRSARANEARRNLLVAHGNGVRALERSSNALIAAGTEARKAAQILAANAAGGQHPLDAFNAVKAEVARQLGYAQQAASDAQAASAAATIQANVLVDTGLPYGADWTRMAQGMAAAASAAVSAAETAQHAIDATAATDQARNAQEKAERHAEEAHQWRLHAEEHAGAAARIADAAKVQADAAKDAAVRTKQARQAAETAETQAWAAAQRTRDARLVAEAEARKAAAARAIAERERAAAGAARARAEQQAAVARSARGEADYYAGIARDARVRAQAQDAIAGGAETDAKTVEGNALTARNKAFDAERNQRAAEARAQAMEAMAQATVPGSAAEKTAKDAAAAARGEANLAMGAAVGARGAANTATGAAVNSRAAATAATMAAARARAAARDAEAAAARANAAANKAEAEAAATHAAALRSNAAAADATANEAKAADAARAAVQLAEQAASEAVQSHRAAERTKAEADAASAEAVSAATQAGIAIRAATAARASSQAITDPANTAIGVVAPFTGGDIDADFTVFVANQAKAVGAEQAKAAQDRANEAVTAANLAAEAAAHANDEIKPAFEAAAKAAASAATAARSAAEAQQAAAEAAADGAAARAAAARANTADAQAHDDAVLARKAANAAANDAAIAGRNAAAAEKDAAAARSAASAAEADAAAARGSADAAEADAVLAQQAADSAQKHADAAAAAVKNALGYAKEAQQAADRAEEAERKAADARKKEAAEHSEANVQELSEEDQDIIEETCESDKDCIDAYNKAKADANKSILDFIKENGADVLLEIIGVNDAKRCFGEGDVAACLWTIINVGSLILLIAKLPKVGSAVTKVVGSLDHFLDAANAGTKFTTEMQATVAALKACKIPNSFTPDTPVLMGDGSRKPIADVVVGDLVLATDPATRVTKPQEVTKLIIGEGVKHLVDIDVETGFGGTGRIVATDGHPFWVKAAHDFVDAKDLKPGDQLRDPAGGLHRVRATVARTEIQRVHNLSVKSFHTYYAFAGPVPVLVHNDGNACTELVHRATEMLNQAPIIVSKALGRTGEIFVKDKHLSTARGRWTKFNTADLGEATRWVEEALAKTGNHVFRTNSGTSIKVFVNMGRPVGTRGEQYIMLCINEEGKVFNAFPKASVPAP
ncbi:polymorphic toxin-type HINT domain-containing protein [Amycolatopsis sp. NPDC059657]|uniref:polymorphic toxin-type HINT domain-containing protein n=1 Tax=Amycolatopsis sp. NPDC059657 TaxID=3346899 RepID=UPI003673128A